MIGWIIMNSIFNTNLEISLRLLLTLYVVEKDKTLDALVISDFVTVYAKDFNLGISNLHGDNEFSYTEFAARRSQSLDAVKALVGRNLVTILETADGFAYSITDRGITVCDSMTTQYAADYINTAYKVEEFVNMQSTTELMSKISKSALRKNEWR
ncbi:ABC-three component system middle component 2 [Clostridium botulinum]|uniref:ABC-three component system middle component 2 n=1 Tax=Clostridium botulinum TaxID=1491 RepID=UPI00117C1CA0|nr:ABC-three component system middle component 2 [Clostridium botulinum]